MSRAHAPGGAQTPRHLQAQPTQAPSQLEVLQGEGYTCRRLGVFARLSSRPLKLQNLRVQKGWVAIYCHLPTLLVNVILRITWKVRRFSVKCYTAKLFGSTFFGQVLYCEAFARHEHGCSGLEVYFYILIIFVTLITSSQIMFFGVSTKT